MGSRPIISEAPAPGGDALTLSWRGMTIFLPADDPRVAAIEQILFGRPSAPEPEPEPEPEPSPEPEPPRVEVPAAWVRLWKSLPEPHRRLLVTLSEGPLTTPALEQRLKLTPRKGVRTLCILIALRAKAAGLKNPVKGRGRGRMQRRLFVVEEARPYVLELERRWTLVEEALARFEG